MVTTRAQEQQLTMHSTTRRAFWKIEHSTPASPRVLRNLSTRSVLSRNYGSLPLVPEKNRNKRILWGPSLLATRTATRVWHAKSAPLNSYLWISQRLFFAAVSSRGANNLWLARLPFFGLRLQLSVEFL